MSLKLLCCSVFSLIDFLKIFKDFQRLFSKSNVNETETVYLVFLQYREIMTVLAIALCKPNFTFFMKIMKSRKKKMALSSFFVSIKKYEWTIHDESFFL